MPPNFDMHSSNAGGGGAMSSFYDPNAYAAPNPYEQDKQFKTAPGNAGTDFDNEPPLLEELGINPNHIFQKVFLWDFV